MQVAINYEFCKNLIFDPQMWKKKFHVEIILLTHITAGLTALSGALNEKKVIYLGKSNRNRFNAKKAVSSLILFFNGKKYMLVTINNKRQAIWKSLAKKIEETFKIIKNEN
jgi:hypothetical protein